MNLAKRDKHDLTCIASPKGEMKSTFSWTNPFKSSTSINQVKLLCSSTSSTLCDPTLAKLNQETEFCITIHITFNDSVVHTGTTVSVPSSPSETNRVSDCKSILVTTPSSRMIPGKLKIEVTKDPIYHVGKNGKHSYGENFIYEYPFVEFLGLQPLIPLLQYGNRLGFEICSVNRTRKLGYVNLNWPRCSARVTESLVLTDGSFCQKQNTLYFRLCKSCEFIMCILIVDHQFNHMHPWCSWECMLPGRCSPGKRCHTFWNRNIVLLPILLGKVSCVPKTTLCELYVVRFWEGLA